MIPRSELGSRRGFELSLVGPMTRIRPPVPRLYQHWSRWFADAADFVQILQTIAVKTRLIRVWMPSATEP